MTTLSPPASSSSMMSAFPAATNKVVLVDTEAFPASSIVGNSTFSWTGTAWIEDSATTVIDASGPLPPRSGAVMCYDGTHAMLFGGKTAWSTPGIVNDTWTLSSALAWSKPTLTTSPVARFDAAAAYLAGTGAVMFGGASLSGTPVVDEGTWIWSGSSWAKTSVVPSTTNIPAPRWGHAMAANTSVALLFGGKLSGPVLSNALHSFNGTVWSKLVPTGTVPSARFGHCMVYDATASLFVIFGGQNQAGLLPPQTFTYNSATNVFAQVSVANGTGPANVLNAQMAYDSTSGKVLLFGGVSAETGQASAQTWALTTLTGVWARLF